MGTAKFRVLVLLAVVALLSGVAHQVLTPREALSDVDVPFMIVAIGLLFLWYRFDSQERGFRRSATLNVMVVALSVVALPYYFFRSMGAAKGLLATFIFLGVAGAYTVLQYGGEYIAYYLMRSN